MSGKRWGRRQIVTVAGVAAAGAAGVALGRPSNADAAVGAVSRPLRITVASSDAPAYVKSEANYVCTGSNDQTVINQAITAAATGPVPGSSERALNAVELSGGRYNCSGSVLLRSGVDVLGAGPFASVLRAVNLTAKTGAGSRPALVKLFDIDTHGCGIHGVTLNGNYGSGGTCDGLLYSGNNSANRPGYPPTSPDPYCYAYDLFVHGFNVAPGRHGVFAETDMRGTFFHTMTVRDCSGDGIVLSGTPDSHIDRVHVGGCTGVGINVGSGNNKVTNSKAFYCGTGMRFTGKRGTVTCLEAQDCTIGFDIGGSPLVAAGITADSCSADGIIVRATGASIDGFQVFNRFTDKTMARGVTFDGSPAEVTMVGRVVSAGITAKVDGRPGANSFVRIAGGAMFSAG